MMMLLSKGLIRRCSYIYILQQFNLISKYDFSSLLEQKMIDISFEITVLNCLILYRFRCWPSCPSSKLVCV